MTFFLFFMFLIVSAMLLHYRESTYWWQHIFSMCFWVLMTIAICLSNGCTAQSTGFRQGFL